MKQNFLVSYIGATNNRSTVYGHFTVTQENFISAGQIDFLQKTAADLMKKDGHPILKGDCPTILAISQLAAEAS